jgi:hypothetical protein
VDEAIQIFREFYRVYHSSRFVRNKLLLRLERRLTDDAVRKLNEEFHDLLVDGDIEQIDHLPEEKNEPDLMHMPRLCLHFNRRNLGKLTRMIHAINASDTVDE